MSIFRHAGCWTGDMTVDEFVAERSKIVTQHKADRVISSPLEVPAIRAAMTRPDFIVVTPGIRPVGSANNDQKRVATPAAAIAGGADYLIGPRRALTLVSSPSLLAELAEVLYRPNYRLYLAAPTPIPSRRLLTCGGWLRSSIRRRCPHPSAAIPRTTRCWPSQPHRKQTKGCCSAEREGMGECG
jgi:hypothetical protein